VAKNTDERLDDIENKLDDVEREVKLDSETFVENQREVSKKNKDALRDVIVTAQSSTVLDFIGGKVKEKLQVKHKSLAESYLRSEVGQFGSIEDLTPNQLKKYKALQEKDVIEEQKIDEENERFNQSAFGKMLGGSTLIDIVKEKSLDVFLGSKTEEEKLQQKNEEKLLAVKSKNADLEVQISELDEEEPDQLEGIKKLQKEQIQNLIDANLEALNSKEAFINKKLVETQDD